MKYENTTPDKDGYAWTDYGCQGCREYKKLKIRKSDGKMLCKKCSKNQSIMIFKTKIK
jgi:formylmethanofuran dehydrogenase subunit E